MATHSESQPAYKLLKINADTLTPIGIFQRLHGVRKFLLESSFEHDKKGRYSYIGSDPYEEIIGYAHTTTVINHETGAITEYPKNALTYLQEHFPKLDLDLPLPFTGGAIGYIGYDAIRQFEEIGAPLPDDLTMPDMHFMVYKNLIIYEHYNQTVSLVSINLDDSDEECLTNRLDTLKAVLHREVDQSTAEVSELQFKSELTDDDFKKRVQLAKDYIDQGDALQIVLSKRMKSKISGNPLSYYRKLRMANPSPYMFYIDFIDYVIIGASPESLIQTNGTQVITNPIAGTRPRGKTSHDDTILKAELLTDQKEVAEHEMLVSLSKDDLRQICDPGSITVPTYMNVEMYQHVMHIVSEVHGVLKTDLTSLDALIASLPAGTVSGSPKVRAMQIINEIEDTKRGFYGGGIGYINFNHDLNMALSIRSLIIKDDYAYLQTGAGIVRDSIPEDEFHETLHKARSLMEVSDIDFVLRSEERRVGKECRLRDGHVTGVQTLLFRSYGGGIGYINFNHDLNMALSIRSLIIKDDYAYLQTGAGIVRDSIPEDEFHETLHKARSLMEVSDIDFVL